MKKYDFLGKTAVVDIACEAVLAVDLPDGLKAGEQLKLDGRSEFGFKDGKIYKMMDIS